MNMNNFSESDHMEIQDAHKIETETIISNDLKHSSDELNLFDDLQKVQIKTEENEADHKESYELGSEIDLQQSADIHDDKNSPSDDILTCGNEIFADVLTKIKAFINEIKQENIEMHILLHEWQIFNDFSI